ncbi:hypothetical protein FOVSG1_005718 [Fusarium oxysporum f. sp. vasinfectum]
MPTAATKRFHLQTLELSSFSLCPVSLSLSPYRPEPSPFASIPLGQSIIGFDALHLLERLNPTRDGSSQDNGFEYGYLSSEALSLTLLFLVLSFPRFCSLFAVPLSKGVDIYLAPVLYIVIPQDSCSSRELKKRDTPQSTSGSIISPLRSFSSADPRYYDPGAFQHCLDSSYLPNTFVPGV